MVSVIKQFIDMVGKDCYGFEMCINSWLVYKRIRPACLFDIPTWLVAHGMLFEKKQTQEFPTSSEQYAELKHLQEEFFNKLNLDVIPYEQYINITDISVNFFVVCSDNKELNTFIKSCTVTNKNIGKILGYICQIDSIDTNTYYITIDYYICGVGLLIEYVPFYDNVGKLSDIYSTIIDKNKQINLELREFGMNCDVIFELIYYGNEQKCIKKKLNRSDLIQFDLSKLPN